MAEEPVGLMFCLECMFKHARDLEHHLEDAVRVTKGVERDHYQELIDRVREIRKEIFEEMTTTKVLKEEKEAIGNPGACSVCGGGNPEIVGNPVPLACDFEKEVVNPKEHFDPSSFRTLCPQSPTGRCKDLPADMKCATRVIIGCPQGQFKGGRCQVGTEAQVIHHAR